MNGKALNIRFRDIRSLLAMLGMVIHAVTIFVPCVEASGGNKLLFLGNRNIPPIVYLDNGAPSGVAVDILRALARNMPQQVDIRAMDWTEAQALVARGEADALVQINQTEERRKIYDFSEPLLESQFSIFCTTDRVGISGISSLHGLRVGVEGGGLPRQLLDNNPRITLTVISNFLEGFNLLNKGAVDAVVVDFRVGSYVIAENKLRNIKVAGEPIAFSYSAIAVKKGNTELLAAINNALRIIKADGTYQKIVDKWKPKEVVFLSREQIRLAMYSLSALILFALLLVAVIWTVTTKKELARRRTVEENLRRLNERYSLAVDAAGLGVWEWDIRENRLVWDDRMYDLYGIGKQDFSGAYEAWLKGVHPDDRARCDELSEHTRRWEREYDTEFRVVWPDGGIRHLKAHGRVVRDASGEPWRMTGVNFDITESKRAENMAQSRLRMLETAYTAGMTLDDTLRRMLDEIEAQTGSCIGFYHFMEEDQQTISLQNWSTSTLTTMCTAECKDDHHYPVAEAGVWCDCVRERRPVIHNDYTSLPHRQGMPAGHAPVVRELVVPVFRGPQIVAIIGVGNKSTDYTETDVQIASLLGDFSWEIVIRKQAEEMLRESEERLRLTLEATQIGTWDWDVRNDRWTASSVYFTMLGYEPKAGPGDRAEWLDRVHPDDRDFVEKKIQEVLSGNPGDYRYEARMLRADGTYRWQQIKGFGITRDGEGRVMRMLGIRMDIDDRKAAEQQLQLLNHALDHVREGAFLIDLRERFLYVNQEACRSLGYTRDELCVMGILDITPYFSTEALQNHLAELLKRDTLTFETLHMARDGRVFPVEISSSVLEYGGVRYLLSLVRDITERKRMEERLAAREHEFRTLAESLPDNIVRYDREGRTVYVNPVLEKTLGGAAADMIGTRVRERHTDGSYEAYAQAVDTALASGEDGEIEFILPVPSEEPIVHQIRIIVERGENGEEIGVLAIGRDITERKRAEQALRDKQQRLSDMTFELSLAEERERRRIATHLHDDIGQDLALARIKLGLLAKGSLTGGGVKILDDAREIIDGIIKNVRFFTRLISPPILESAGLEAALKWLGRQVETDYGLRVLFHDDLSEKTVSREIQAEIYNATRELLINVAKHAETDTALVAVGRENDGIVIMVEDDGIGFDPDAIEENLIREGGGFGLFNIRRRIIYQGGTFHVASAPGAGTRVTIGMPLSG